MRINIEINDDLIKKALQAGPYNTIKEAVSGGLKCLVEKNHQRKIRNYRGKLKWDGNPEDMRGNS